MTYTYAVLGAGMQGTCAAYDLAKNGDAKKVFLCDSDPWKAQAAAERVNVLLGNKVVIAKELWATNDRELTEFFINDKVNACLSCLPFSLNVFVAEICVECGVHFNDLGGNTAEVKKILALDDEAKKKNISLVPDCGVAPGMINVLARMLFEEKDRFCDDIQVRMHCGGLPQNKNLPLGYKLLFNPGGLTNEYTGKAQLIRNNKLEEVDTLEESENIKIDNQLFEARTTSGGTSTCPEELEGKLHLYQYKTLRYPGHWETMKAFKDFGTFDEEQIEGYDGGCDNPTYREVFHELAKKKWTFPDEPDVLYLHIRVNDCCESDTSLTLIDKQDEVTGFSAMERTTAFGATVITIMQAQGKIKPGARTPMSAVENPTEYYLELVNRGFKFTTKENE